MNDIEVKMDDNGQLCVTLFRTDAHGSFIRTHIYGLPLYGEYGNRVMPSTLKKIGDILQLDRNAV